MSTGQVLRFEYQQSLSILPDKSGWSDSLSISVRVLSEAITSGWYRSQFGKHTSDFVVLVGIVMHARPLIGKDLAYLIALGIAKPEDEGRLYARVTDIGLAEELGLHRQTVAGSANRMAEKGFLSILDIPDRAEGFRDSHGRFGGSKVYLLAGDLQQRFLQKDIQDRDEKTDTVEAYRAENTVPDPLVANCHAEKNSTVAGRTAMHREENSDNPAERVSINQKDSEEVDEEEDFLSRRILDHFASAKGLSSYHPSRKELEALDSLFRDGYSQAEILAGIDSSFRRTWPRYFTLCSRVIRELPPGSHPESCSAAPRTQPESDAAEARPEPDLVIETPLVRPAGILAQAGEPLNAGQLRRLRLMAERCEAKARLVGSTGSEWVADALARGVGAARPGNLLAYADAVLDDWIANGRVRQKKPARNSTPRSKVPKGHQAIEDYLRKREGDLKINGI